MKQSVEEFDFDKRSEEKRLSRRGDERALAAASKRVESLKAENEVFAPLAAASRVDLSASRSLS